MKSVNSAGATTGSCWVKNLPTGRFVINPSAMRTSCQFFSTSPVNPTATASPATSATSTIPRGTCPFPLFNTNFAGNDLGQPVQVIDTNDCCTRCSANSACNGWVVQNVTQNGVTYFFCYLKSSMANQYADNTFVAG
jgi:hypothetical protein